jgi:hypothetical protein
MSGSMLYSLVTEKVSHNKLPEKILRLCIFQVSFAKGTRLYFYFIKGTRHKKSENSCLRNKMTKKNMKKKKNSGLQFMRPNCTPIIVNNFLNKM